MPMPTRFGHEFSGDVEAVGAGVTAFAPGDAVMCTHTAPDGTCFWCRQGQEELCERVMPDMILGAYADLIAVPPRVVEQNCFHKPAGVSYTQGAFLEPLACVVHSLALLAPEAGSTVAVIGNGGFGILHALLLQRDGVDALLFGRRSERLTLAAELGLQSIDSRAVPIERSILERTDGRGADVVIECTGTVEMWESAPSLVRRGGRVSFFAGLPGDARVNFLAARLALRRGTAARAVSLQPGRRSRRVRANCRARLAAGTAHLARLSSRRDRDGLRTARCRRRHESDDTAMSPRSMQAAVLYDIDDIRIEERPVPALSDGDVLVRAAASGICSGDVMAWYIRRKAPLVLGHEPAGVVAEVRGESEFAVGDRVFVHHHAPCFECRACRPRQLRSVRDVARHQDRSRRNRRILSRRPREPARHAAAAGDGSFRRRLAGRAARVCSEVVAPQRAACRRPLLHHRAGRHGIAARLSGARDGRRGRRRRLHRRTPRTGAA